MYRFLIAFLILTFLPSVNLDCVAGSPNSREGRWKGQWTSVTTGHRGPLRARVRAVDHDTYRAIFAGRFAGVIPFVYPAKLERVDGTCDCYTSSQRLPLLGTYRMTAKITPGTFNAVFQGKRDSGRFDLSR